MSIVLPLFIIPFWVVVQGKGKLKILALISPYSEKPKATVTPDRSIYGSYDWLRWDQGATGRILRSVFLLVVCHRTIGRTRGRATNNDWRRSMA